MDPRLLLMHQVMLADRSRLEAYDKALKAQIKPGDTVIDVGAGTLILSMLALAHGAGRVYAIEAEPELAELGTRVALDNGVGDRVTTVQGDARTVRLPDKADVIVTEMMGNLGPEEQMAEIVGAVKRHNLRSGGLVIPGRLATTLTPIQFDGEGWGIWDEEFYGYRLDRICQTTEPKAQLHFFARAPIMLGPAMTIFDDELRSGVSHPSTRVTAPIERAGRLHAVMGAFVADLGAGVELANFPSRPGANWAVWIWPLRHVPVEAGDRLEIAVRPPPPSRPGSVRDYADWRLDCRLVRNSGAKTQPRVKAPRAKAQG